MLSIKEVSELTTISVEDITDFLLIKHYIQKVDNGYRATAMGVEFGMASNEQGEKLITEKCVEVIKRAFAYKLDSKSLSDNILMLMGVSAILKMFVNDSDNQKSCNESLCVCEKMLNDVVDNLQKLEY